ncbi:acyl--CoA ligase [Bacillus siamensis]|uniref:class I adenylate-forming enzyme family protein n=1 Tax=Bacillus siamensis TaxID=659243 RepID=UPI0018E622A9|nr:class I adenylate-forming enzyme family protein [Bacillus siamensis]QQD80617.1 acyl--CoA ligase [Bacillus siamensis]
MLLEYIEKLSKKKLNSVAFLSEQKSITYSFFLYEVKRTIKFFKSCGLTSETPLAIIIEKNETIWSTIVAASYLKIPVLLVDPNLKEAEMNQIMNLYQTCFELRETKSSICDKNNINKLNIFDNEYLLINSGILADCWNEYIYSDEDKQSYIVLLTSGSTKVPSAVVKTVSSIIGDGERIGRSLGITSSDRVLCVAPVYHAFGLICGCFAAFLTGATVSFIGSYVLPSTIENRVRYLSCTIIMALPFHYKMMLNHVEKPFDQIRFALSSTSPISADIIESCKRKLNLSIVNIYGSSEAGGISIQYNENFKGSCNSTGEIIDEVLIKLDKTESVQVDGIIVSELLINSPSLALGYLKIEGLEQKLYTLDEGWWRTGDLVYFDKQNQMNFAGRVNITINVNGKKVNPYEIEEVLSKHPAIEEVVVVGQSDDKRGEIPVAFVVLKEHVTQQEVLQFCYQRLSNYKIPKKIEFRDKLPKNSAGKIRRKELSN